MDGLMIITSKKLNKNWLQNPGIAHNMTVGCYIIFWMHWVSMEPLTDLDACSVMRQIYSK